jgi:hypothetical protein
MDKKAIRTIVKDILGIIKTNKKGEFSLPEDINDEMVYDFSKIKNLSINLIIVKNKSVKTFLMNGDYEKYEDVITIKIVYNPTIDLTKHYYDIVGELNDILAHEMEHYFQYNSGRFDLKPNRAKKPITYYLKPEEIGAQIQGFKRLAKLRRLTFESVVQKWFDTHTETHMLSNAEVKKVVDNLINNFSLKSV